MIKVSVGVERLDEHIVYVKFHSVSKVVFKHLVNQPLVGCACILQTERHDLVTKDIPLSDEYGLLLIVWVHKDLIIA